MFESRRDLYKLSDPAHPEVRHQERQAMFDLVKIEPHHLVCDVLAWGGYFADGAKELVKEPSQITVIEPSPGFNQDFDPAFRVVKASAAAIPIEDNTFDRTFSLVGLHHFDNKQKVIDELYRITKPGGLVGVSEVLVDSPVARFLNGPVDILSTGHRGTFVKHGDLVALLVKAGCSLASEVERPVKWIFDDREQMARFVRGLLGLNKATDTSTLKALEDGFDLEERRGLVVLPWTLVYAFGQKR